MNRIPIKRKHLLSGAAKSALFLQRRPSIKLAKKAKRKADTCSQSKACHAVYVALRRRQMLITASMTDMARARYQMMKRSRFAGHATWTGHLLFIAEKQLGANATGRIMDI